MNKKKIDKKRYRSIKFKLKTTFLMIGIIPIIIVGTFAYKIAENKLQKKSSDFSLQILNQINVSLNLTLSDYVDQTTAILLNSKFDNILSDVKKNNYNYYTYTTKTKEIEDYLNSDIASDWNISGFCVMQNNGSFIGTIDEDLKTYFKTEFKNLGVYNEIKESKGQVFWISGIKNRPEVFLVRKYIDKDKKSDYGLLVMIIKPTVFEKLFESMNLSSENSIQIVNKNVIYNSKSNNNDELAGIIQNVMSRKESGYFIENNQLVSFTFSDNGWIILSEIPMNSLISEIRISGLLTLIIGVICAILAIIIGVRVSVSITKPIEDIIKLMNIAKNGDLTVKLNYLKSNEIGDLSNNFNLMIQKIKQLISETKKVSDTVLKNTGMITQISNTSAESSEQISISVKEIVTDTMKDAEESDKAMKEMNTLAEKIEKIREKTVNINSISNSTNQLGIESMTIVDELLKNTKEVLEKFLEVSRDVNKLKDDSKEIEKIVDVISSISEETNLLALNASIEAARAGEAGKGFSVVANEITKLSEQSNRSTNMIRNIIKGIQSRTNNTFEVVKETEIIFNNQEKCVNNTANSLKNIILATEDILSNLGNIEIMVNDINKDKEKTITSIRNISLISENSAAMTEEVLASAEEQNSLAKQLNGLSNELYEVLQLLGESIDKFKI